MAIMDAELPVKLCYDWLLTIPSEPVRLCLHTDR